MRETRRTPAQAEIDNITFQIAIAREQLSESARFTNAIVSEIAELEAKLSRRIATQKRNKDNCDRIMARFTK